MYKSNEALTIKTSMVFNLLLDSNTILIFQILSNILFSGAF